MTAYDLAALDMAGTTIDEGGLVYEVLAATVGDAVGALVPPDLLSRWKGTSKSEAVAGLLAGLDADASPVAVTKVFDDFTDRLIATYRETPPSPFPGVLDMFATLRSAGIKVVLQTGYSADIADSIIAGLGWSADTVDAVITSDQVSQSRPAPYLIFRSMEAVGATSVARVLVAGDTPNDLRAGFNAGAGFIVGVGTGSFTLDQLRAAPHTDLFDTVAQIARLRRASV